MNMDTVPIEILLVEDTTGDAELIIDCLERSRVCNNVRRVRDGEQAMACLRSEGAYAGAPRPDLVLLDLNLPRMDGREVLAAMKQDPDLRHIPVVVLTSSDLDTDIARTYDLQASSFITKPMDPDEFLRVVRSVGDYWLAIVRLPSEGGVRVE